MSDMNTSAIEGPRGSRSAEFAEVLDFLNFVFRSNSGRQPSIGGDYPHLYQPENADNFRIIRQNGRIVSCVAIFSAHVQWGDAVLKIGGIGGVSTHPDARKQGLAGRILVNCIETMQEQDYDLSILWTGIHDYYRRWGWEHAGTQWDFTFDRCTINFLPVAPSGEVITDARSTEVLEAVHAMRTATDHGVVWDKARTELTLNAVHRGSVKLLVQDGKPVAYILYRNTKDVHVFDHGGDPEAVLGLCRTTFGEANLPSMCIATWKDNDGIGKMLMDKGFNPKLYNSGMLLLLNPQRILEKYGVTDVIVEPSGDGWSVTYDGKKADYTKNELSKFIFGPERPGKHTHPDLPLPLFYGDSDRM